MAQYGEVRVDYITYTTGTSPSEANATVTVSSLVNNPRFSGDINVEGNGIIEGNLNVSGNSTFNSIVVSGNSVLNGDLTVSGNTVLNTLNVTGNTNLEDVEISGTLTVTGDAIINGDLTVSGDINASGIAISGFTGLFTSGTESSPSITFVDDEDTGIYNPLPNEIGIVVSGNSAVRVDSRGYVGIGVDLAVEPSELLAPLHVDNLNGAGTSGLPSIIHCDGINDRRFKIGTLKGTTGVSQAIIGSVGCVYNNSGNTAASGYVHNALIDFKRGASSDNGYMGFRTGSGNAGFIYSNGNWIIGDKEDAINNNAGNTTALHIYKDAPILTIQDRQTTLANASATLRLAESDANGHPENLWDIQAFTNGTNNFALTINPSNNGNNNTFVITRASRIGVGYVPGQAGVEDQSMVLARTGEGIRLQNVNYASNQDAPYLIVSADDWTGQNTNWGTYGFQHRIKSDSGGTARVTIDSYAGENFAMTNAGNVIIGGGTITPQMPLVVSRSQAADLAMFENNYTAAGTNAFITFRHGGTNQCRTKVGSYRSGQNAGADYQMSTSNSNGVLVKRQQCTEEGKHSLYGIPVSTLNNDGTLVIDSKSSTASGTALIGVGPSLQFAGSDASNSTRTFAMIAGVKSNNTDNNFDGVLQFFCRRNGEADLDERARISKDGYFGINEKNPERHLHVTRSASTAYNITAYLAKGADSNFQLAVSNGTSNNSSGQAVSRVGTYYKLTNVWDAHIDFTRGSGSDNGSIKLVSNGNERILVNPSNVEINGGRASNGFSIQGSAPQLYFDETGSTGANKRWAVTRDGDGLSMRWDNKPPYAIQGVTNGGASVTEVRLKGGIFTIDSSDRVNVGNVNSSTITTVTGSVACQGRLQSIGSYNGTTANAANLAINTAGIILRSTSSIRYKTDIEPMQDEYADALLNCQPVWYRSTCEDDRSDHSYYGFIAEDVAKIDPRLVHWEENEFETTLVSGVVNAGPNETTVAAIPLNEPIPGGVAYDRFVPALVNVINRQKQAISDLETRLAKLENSV